MHGMRLVIVLALACACGRASPARVCRDHPTAFTHPEMFDRAACDVTAPGDGGATLVACDTVDDAFTMSEHTTLHYGSVADFVAERKAGLDRSLGTTTGASVLSTALAGALGWRGASLVLAPAYRGGVRTGVEETSTISWNDGGITRSISQTQRVCAP